jgi:hypothetical protein
MLRGVARLRSGKEPTVTIEAKAWLTSLACGKAKELNCGTTRLLARHAREHGRRRDTASSTWRRELLEKAASKNKPNNRAMRWSSFL